MKISFINFAADVCERVGADVGQVAEEPELRTLVDATLQTLTGTRAPSLTRHG